MDTHELMFGDWVHFDDVIEPVYSKNIRIYQPENDHGYVTSKSGTEYNSEHLRPIQLTAEILENNGFMKNNGFINDENAAKYEYGNNVCKVSIYYGISTTVGKNWSIILTNEDIDCAYKSDIEYVHELQHIFRITGIKIDINVN